MKTRTHGDDPTVHHYYGPWHILVKLSRCLCEDGVGRTIIVREPDTFFSIPGRTHAHGKTVTGFVSRDDDLDRLTFTACGKNGAVIQPKASS